MILVDTSVWIEHLRRGLPTLATALEAGQVLTHPFVLGELACGNLRHRERVLGLLGELSVAPLVTDREALAFIENGYSRSGPLRSATGCRRCRTPRHRWGRGSR